MGLDMTVYSFTDENWMPIPDQMVDIGPLTITDKENEFEELHYWRKHYKLHDWFENLYRQYRGRDTFNSPCNVRIVSKDLDALEIDLKNYKIPCSYNKHKQTLEDDLEFVRKARVRLAEGKILIYRPCW